MTAIACPRKTRELHSHHFDSTVWNDVRFRTDDIVIGTYAKSGTTWTQQIVAQLLFNGAENLEVAEMSPWVDLRVPPKEVKLPAIEAQTHRRFLKTHLPVDALVFSPQARYLYIARDGRDVVWSLCNHHVNANATWYALLNDTPGRAGPPIERPPSSVRRYFLDWLERDGHPFWPFWENIRSWWEIRHLPNVMLLHFDCLKRDMGGQNAANRGVPRDSHRRGPLGGDRSPLQFRLHEEPRHQECAARRHLLGWRGRDVHQQGHEWPLARYADSRRQRHLRGPGHCRVGSRLRPVVGDGRRGLVS